MSRNEQPSSGRPNRLSRRNILRSAVLTGVSSGALAATGSADSSDTTDLDLETGAYAQDDVLREDYWVETGTDTDGTGESDRVHVEIARPASTENTPLPVVVEPSPYYGGIGGPISRRGPNMATELYRPGESQVDSNEFARADEQFVTDEEELVEFTGSSRPDSIGPGAYEEIFLQQGYVWAYAASIGTEESTGCPTTGDDAEIQGIKAVVDWFNGRATAYDSKVGGSEVAADWTTGSTGMIGASYNGTLPNGVAATGVDGLETIVPIVAISSWYDYYRSNGAVLAPGSRSRRSIGNGVDVLASRVTTRENAEICESVIDDLAARNDWQTGNYNELWAERNYRPDANEIDASVLLVHGLDDLNVKIPNATAWLDVLKANDVPYKVWFHQAAHDVPIEVHDEDRARQWVDLLTDWWAYWLKGEDNGVMDRPTATVQRRGDGDLETWPIERYDDWPVPTAQHVPVSLTPGGSERGGLVLGDWASDVESLVDDSETPPLSLFDTQESDNRLLYTSGPLEEDVHLSGRPTVDLTVASDDEIGLVSAAIVDFDPDGNAYDVNRGWMNLQNRDSLSETQPITPGQPYDVEFSIQAVDHVFEAGHEIGIAIYSSDYNFTKRPPSEPELSVTLAENTVELPAVGGEDTLDAAFVDGAPSCGEYIDGLGADDEVTISDLRTAVKDWQSGSIATPCMKTVLDAWARND